MEEALMRAIASRTNRLRSQAGFSMIEMLMTAFVLAVGILGLSMLQLMSIKASRGGRSLSTAVLVGEHVMEQVEMEGRLSYLNQVYTPGVANLPADLPNLKYVSLGNGPGSALLETFNSHGGPITDPTDPTPFYRVVTTKNAFATAAGTTGILSDFTVVVNFTDQLDQASLPIVRTVTLTRRINHG
jgi:prepilin-type N-terminal cleavage/methylation domain-containing protein